MYQLNINSDIKLTFDSPIVSSVLIDSTLYVTEIGIMNPSEIPKGVIYSLDSDTLVPLGIELHSPVYSEINDLNGDGENEIIICEFGHLTGSLSLLVKNEETYDKKCSWYSRVV
ncbi:MAG: hypothetical protein P8K68_10105 [Algibacter sp.]|uniref:hypothetical protein n=1 Tax=Algibacter sp. TaxID=1872428 RepID=UPI002605C34E|nr:hypothetical protein [Algibacter sp.]MDG1730243.1 hypothetical protein [Algibacter sp.]MDG2179122.1 hypothetical protein [Algibacter sp.]